MIRAAVTTFVLCAASPVLAQQQATSLAQGAMLRALDKVSGQTTDIEVGSGSVAQFGRLNIRLSECRFPQGNPAGDAYAGLRIPESGKDGFVFDGWMIASAPALSAMDHQRYDVWVMRCTTS